jgi:prepilin-type N-terminal cleavage/methylation domain-containing protein
MITNRIRSRAGVTLLELLVALVVGAVIMQIALSFFARQGRSFSNGVAAMGTMQNARFAINTMEKDVRTMGIGVLANQPSLVYAGPDVMAFNANYASNLSTDLNAVYVDQSAPAGQVEAATTSSRFTIPMTSTGYPDGNYNDGASNSPAETISFFFQPDPTTTRTDDFVLYRQVNGTTPAVVARNLLKAGGQQFLEYMAVEVPAEAATRMVTLGSGPYRHSAAVHGSGQDAGAAAKVDSIRAVRVRFSVTSGTAGPADPVRTVDRTIRMPNAGISVRSVCGDAPQGVALGATLVALPDGTKAVRLAW